MKIRLARDDDYSAMARLRKQTIRHVNSQDYSENVIFNWSAKGNTHSFRIAAMDCKRWVAVDNNKIVGFSEHNFKGELSRIYVHKDYLRQGVGSRLLKIAEDSLAQQGWKEINIESTITAKYFYEKNGYKVIMKTRSEGDNAPVYKMLKQLN